jgi:hypothetical protein
MSLILAGCHLETRLRGRVASLKQPLALQSPAVTICTTSLTFNNFTFCPHSVRVFMCFVWISEQTVIISLYSINGTVFVIDAVCVLYEVVTECVLLGEY